MAVKPDVVIVFVTGSVTGPAQVVIVASNGVVKLYFGPPAHDPLLYENIVKLTFEFEVNAVAAIDSELFD